MTWPSSASSTDVVALVGGVDQAVNAAHRRQTQGSGHDGGVAGGAGFLDGNARDAPGVPVQQLRRTQPSGHQDRAVGLRRGHGLAVECPQQSAGDVLEVGQPFAQIGVGDAPHPVAQVADDALHGRFRGQAALDRRSDAGQPAGVGGDHAVCLQHVAGGGGIGAAILHCRQPSGDQVVQFALHLACSDVEAGQLSGRIIGQQPARQRPYPPQRDPADGQSTDQSLAGEIPRHGAAQAFRTAAGCADPGQHLGQQHRHGLQNLDLVLPKLARITVLDRQHAQGPPGPSHRHRQQRRIGLLAGLRSIGERGMVLRVRQIEDLSRRSAQPDDALADTKPRLADGLLSQPLGRRQLKDVPRAHGVDRADVTAQLDRHQPDEFEQRRLAPGHQVSHARQQPAGRAHHGGSACGRAARADTA